MAVDSLGNLFFADNRNHRVRKVGADGIITTVAGNGYTERPSGNGGYSGDGGAATNARLNRPQGVAVDGLGNVFIADSSNRRIRKVDTKGIITTVAGRDGFGDFSDGVAATSAYLIDPTAVAGDGAGNLLIAEPFRYRVRKVGANHIISTVAGNGIQGYSGDGGAATNANLSGSFYGVALDGSGNLFIADSGNNRIRKVGTNGIITTVAGTGIAGSFEEGGAATDADLNAPWGTAVDAAGNIFLAEGNRVRKVEINGRITSVTAAANAMALDLAVDSLGNLFIANSDNHRIRKILAYGPTLELNNAAAQQAGNYDVVVTSPFGSVTSGVAVLAVAQPPADIADDFSDGNDDGWTRYDALAGSYADYIPATFTVTDGHYRIRIPKPPTNPTGYVRALPYRADQTYTDFEVAADAVAWDESTGSWVGVLGRMNQIGTGKTAGYMLWYYPPNHVLSLNILRNEAGSAIAPSVALTLDPTHQYRFTLTGIGERLTGTVVDLAAPDVVLASITGMSAAYPSGYCGLLCGSFTGADVTYDNFVARTPSPAPPSLNLTAAPGVQFQKPVRYATGLFPHGIDKGDFNRDGSLDLVVANSRGSSVSVFLGHADGSFTKQQDYAVGAGPLSPVAAKFNADDFLDLVVANGSSTNVSVLLGQAGGTLADKVNFTVGSKPTSIAVGDFNKDGALDLVTANSGSTNVSVLLGNGDGAFKDKTDYTVGKAPLVVRAADLNGDGFLDLVTANSGEDTISVLLGRGDGSFQDKVSYPVGKGPCSGAIGDFNGDGHPDVAVANRSANSVMVLPGKADGTLGAPVSTTFVRSPWDLVVADLNNDGQADLVVTTTVVGQVALLLGTGDGSFGSASSVLDVGDNCTDAIVADFNRDQQPDLAVVCQFGDRFEVLFNRGKPAVASPAVELSWPLPADEYVLEAADAVVGSWTPVNTAPVDLPSQKRAVGLERTGNQRYFRLRKP
jgi:sugar lactone lactonase YvrE